MNLAMLQHLDELTYQDFMFKLEDHVPGWYTEVTKHPLMCTLYIYACCGDETALAAFMDSLIELDIEWYPDDTILLTEEPQQTVKHVGEIFNVLNYVPLAMTWTHLINKARLEYKSTNELPRSKVSKE